MPVAASGAMAFEGQGADFAGGALAPVSALFQDLTVGADIVVQRHMSPPGACALGRSYSQMVSLMKQFDPMQPSHPSSLMD